VEIELNTNPGFLKWNSIVATHQHSQGSLSNRVASNPLSRKERFDRELKEFFAIKDEVTIKIIGSVRGTLSSEEWRGPSAKGASNLDAYEKTMEGIDHLERFGGGRDDIALARKKFEEAIALDLRWSIPYHFLSNVYLASWRFGADLHESLGRALWKDPQYYEGWTEAFRKVGLLDEVSKN
jgi:hypothetical protein